MPNPPLASALAPRSRNAPTAPAVWRRNPQRVVGVQRSEVGQRGFAPQPGARFSPRRALTPSPSSKTVGVQDGSRQARVLCTGGCPWARVSVERSPGPVGEHLRIQGFPAPWGFSGWRPLSWTPSAPTIDPGEELFADSHPPVATSDEGPFPRESSQVSPCKNEGNQPRRCSAARQGQPDASAAASSAQPNQLRTGDSPGRNKGLRPPGSASAGLPNSCSGSAGRPARSRQKKNLR